MPHLRAPIVTWAILVALTAGSVIAAEVASSHAIVVATVFGVAVIKALLVAQDYMEVGEALPIWGALYRTWIAMLGAVLLVGHLVTG